MQTRFRTHMISMANAHENAVAYTLNAYHLQQTHSTHHDNPNNHKKPSTVLEHGRVGHPLGSFPKSGNPFEDYSILESMSEGLLLCFTFKMKMAGGLGFSCWLWVGKEDMEKNMETAKYCWGLSIGFIPYYPPASFRWGVYLGALQSGQFRADRSMLPLLIPKSIQSAAFFSDRIQSPEDPC